MLPLETPGRAPAVGRLFKMRGLSQGYSYSFGTAQIMTSGVSADGFR
jgi:hypothetical protein